METVAYQSLLFSCFNPFTIQCSRWTTRVDPKLHEQCCHHYLWLHCKGTRFVSTIDIVVVNLSSGWASSKRCLYLKPSQIKFIAITIIEFNNMFQQLNRFVFICWSSDRHGYCWFALTAVIPCHHLMEDLNITVNHTFDWMYPYFHVACCDWSGVIMVIDCSIAFTWQIKFQFHYWARDRRYNICRAFQFIGIILGMAIAFVFKRASRVR